MKTKQKVNLTYGCMQTQYELTHNYNTKILLWNLTIGTASISTLATASEFYFLEIA